MHLTWDVSVGEMGRQGCCHGNNSSTTPQASRNGALMPCVTARNRLSAQLLLYRMVAEALDAVVVDHADRLHVGVNDGGTDEFEAALGQILGNPVR